MGEGIPTRPGRTLAQRAGVEVAEPPAARAAAVRHVWVQGLLDDPGRHPGVLLEWRRTTGWQGLVVYVVDEGASGVRCVQRWVDADRMSPCPT